MAHLFPQAVVRAGNSGLGILMSGRGSTPALAIRKSWNRLASPRQCEAGNDFVVTGRVTGSGSDARVTMTLDSEIGALTFEGDVVAATQVVGLVTSGAGQIVAVTLLRAD